MIFFNQFTWKNITAYSFTNFIQQGLRVLQVLGVVYEKML